MAAFNACVRVDNSPMEHDWTLTPTPTPKRLKLEMVSCQLTRFPLVFALVGSDIQPFSEIVVEYPFISSIHHAESPNCYP